MTNTTHEEEIENIRARFASLGPLVTTAEIADATGRTPVGVQNWINAFEDFPEAVGKRGRSHLRDRDAVSAWYLAQSFATGENRGRKRGSRAAPTPPAESENASATPAARKFVTSAFAALPQAATADQIAVATGHSPAAVAAWASRPGFPAPQSKAKATGPLYDRDQVLAWFLDQPWWPLTVAFAELPELVTRAQIAQATGRTPAAVANWVASEGFPEAASTARPDGRGRPATTWDRRNVLSWFVEQPFSQGAQRGPKDVTSRALSAAPKQTRLVPAEIAASLGLHLRTVGFWASKDMRPDDPYPPADDSWRREWAAVRSWVLRASDPVPDDASGEEILAWVLRHAGEPTTAAERVKDEHGLLVGQRDAVERARLARQAGYRISATAVAEAIGLPGRRVSDLIPATESPLKASHAPLHVIADDLGVDFAKLRYYAGYYRVGEDPFPAVETGGREITAVRDWLERRGLLQDSAPDA